MIDIDFNSDHERELFEKASIGIAAQDFLNSPLGRYIRKRAIDDRQDAMEKLAEADPAETCRITKYQADAKIAISVLEWLSDAINEGNQASHELEVEGLDGT